MSTCSVQGCRHSVTEDGEYCPLHRFQCKKCDIRLSKQNNLCIYCSSQTKSSNLSNIATNLYVGQIEKFVEEEALKHLAPQEK